MLKIAIGTTSKYKINAIEKVLHQLDFDFEIYPVKVASEASEQPHKENETQAGSINRAKNALTKNPECNIGLGVEFGYEPHENGYRMVCWATVITSNGEVFSEHSSSLELPIKLVELLIEDKDISENLETVLDIEDNEVSRYFKTFLFKRKVIYECVESVMIHYLLRDEVYGKSQVDHK